MIVDQKNVGRYVFIFDINDRSPFRGKKYIDGNDISWEFVETNDLYGLIAPFNEINSWLDERTKAFRVIRVMMVGRNNEITKPIIHPISANFSAIAVYVPEDLAVLFRLFWYDG